jgi:hypothetical protein
MTTTATIRTGQKSHGETSGSRSKSRAARRLLTSIVMAGG